MPLFFPRWPCDDVTADFFFIMGPFLSLFFSSSKMQLYLRAFSLKDPKEVYFETCKYTSYAWCASASKLLPPFLVRVFVSCWTAPKKSKNTIEGSGRLQSARGIGGQQRRHWKRDLKRKKKKSQKCTSSSTYSSLYLTPQNRRRSEQNRRKLSIEDVLG